MQSRLLLRSMAALMALGPVCAPGAFAQVEVGNGGDAVECESHPDNPFAGTYALDYLLTYRQSNGNADVPPVAGIDASLQRIHAHLLGKVPELADTFAEFVATVRNVDDYTRPRIWEEAPFGLVDLTDEQIIGLTPANCRTGDRVRIVQAVVRQPAGSSGLPDGKILYRYVPQVFEQLAGNSPLQLSFLLVHEWLWDHSNNVDRNRRVNRFLHSQAFFNGNAEQVRAQLRALGLAIGPANPDGGGKILQVGGDGACFLWKRRLTCWGRHKDLPALLNPVNPRLLAVGQYHVCVADDEGVKCTSNLHPAVSKVPPMRDVTALTAGYENACAVHRDGITCWGFGFESEPSPNISVPFAASSVVLASTRGCAYGSGKHQCWSRMSSCKADVPWPAVPYQFGRIKRVALGACHMCTEDESGLRCEGENEYGQSQPPLLNGIRDFAVGNEHSCALDRDGVICWGQSQHYNGMPVLQEPKVIGVGNYHNCALDKAGVKCWGKSNGVGQLDVPAHLQVLTD